MDHKIYFTRVFILEESYSNNSSDLIRLKKYLERIRWRYYLGEVLGIAFMKPK